jgi:virulence-associated protein VapD
MTFRPTTLERAYQLARGGECRTVSDIKQKLQAEGFERIQDSLYGPSLTSALRKLCQEHFTGTVAADSPPEASQAASD